MLKVVLCMVLVLAFFAPQALAQNQMLEVIYLKNGSIIKGMIVEQEEGVSITIETENGSRFVCDIADVEKIVKIVPKETPVHSSTFGQGLEVKGTGSNNSKSTKSKNSFVNFGVTILHPEFEIDQNMEIEGTPIHFFTTQRNHYIGWYLEAMAPGIVSAGLRLGGGQERFRLHWETLGLSLEPVNSNLAWLYGVGLVGLNLRGGPFLLAPRIGAVLGWSILTLTFENGETVEESGYSGFVGWSYELGFGLGLKKAGIYAAYCVFKPLSKTMSYTVEEGVTLTGTYDNPHEIRLGIYVQQ